MDKVKKTDKTAQVILLRNDEIRSNAPSPGRRLAEWIVAKPLTIISDQVSER